MTIGEEGLIYHADSLSAGREESPIFIQPALSSIYVLNYNLGLAQGPRPCLESGKLYSLG